MLVVAEVPRRLVGTASIVSSPSSSSSSSWLSSLLIFWFFPTIYLPNFSTKAFKEGSTLLATTTSSKIVVILPI